MFLHENERCPVCDKLFDEKDDIVICHKCGTPHHRECYYQLGRCANADKHSEGFAYEAPETDNNCVNETVNSSEAAAQNDIAAYFEPPSYESTKTTCNSCGKEINKSAPFCCYCGAKQDFPAYSQAQPINFPFSSEFDDDNDTETIDGKRVKDIRAVVKSNTERFIKKFRKQKSTSWNWGGFFFGPYYLFFRKMYKEGIIAMALQLIAELVINGRYVEQITAFSKAVAGYNELITAHSQISPAQLQAYIDEMVPLAQALFPAIMIIMAVRITVNIVVALFSDKLYRTKVMSLIDKVDKSVSEGASFAQLGFMQSGSNANQAQLRSFYLSKSGGTSFFAPIFAYLILNFILSFIL